MNEKERLAIELGTTLYVNTIESLCAENQALKEKLAERGMEWLNAKESKPKQGERVLLKIAYEDCPVVGYWGCGVWGSAQ